MRIGTNHFLSRDAAVRYYFAQYGADAHIVVAQKLLDGEIHIGRPTTKTGEHAYLIDGATRWAIESN
jgi:hypothetical protein